MATFDPVTWRARSAARFDRASEAKKPYATTRHVREQRCIDGLKIVVEWCGHKGLSVNFKRHGPGGTLFVEEKSITINSHLPPDQQLYMLLHECGHWLIGNRERDERYGRGYGVDDPNDKKTLVHRMDIVDEEFEAWGRGRKLAGRLGIKIDKDAFHKARARYIKSYMKWALQVDGYGGPVDAEEDSSPT